MIKIENLVHKYTIWKDENTKSEKTVLDGISLDIPSGQFVAILGPNGSGKSTLARHLNVLLLPDEGKVWIDGKDTQAKERLYEIRSRVGMVFQNPDNQIIGTSVEEDVAFGPENKNVEPEKIRKIVEDVLRKVRLWEKRKTPPSKLSGGQKQRLATADALAGIPECLVLDEPTAMLDPSSRKEVINIVKELNQKEGMTIILITHHTDEVVDADRIILMKDGKIIGDDTPKKIFADHSLLKSAKMDIPPVVELSMRLKKQNIGLDEPVLHEQEMIRKLQNYIEVNAELERCCKVNISHFLIRSRQKGRQMSWQMFRLKSESTIL